MKNRIAQLRSLNVKYQRASSLSLSVSLKPLIGFVSVCALFLAAILLMMLNHGGNDTANRLRMALSDTLAPVVQVISSPSMALDRSLAWLHDMTGMMEENKRLKAENATLLQWQSVAEHLQTENAELKTLLDIRKESPASFITSRVISVPDYSFSHTFLINSGTVQGVQKHQAVMASEGMIGRVLDSAAESAHVLLLTDINARIPVIASRNGEKAILAGNNTENPELIFTAANAKFKIGDRLMSASDGSVVPAGLPVGEILSHENGRYKVRLFAKPTQTDFVKVVVR